MRDIFDDSDILTTVSNFVVLRADIPKIKERFMTSYFARHKHEVPPTVEILLDGILSGDLEVSFAPQNPLIRETRELLQEVLVSI